MILPCMEFFSAIFHVFQRLWVPWVKQAGQQKISKGNYSKNPKIWTPEKFAIITLKFEQDGFIVQ